MRPIANRRFTAIIEREGNGYVALCPEVDVASQGDTVDEARNNLRGAGVVLRDRFARRDQPAPMNRFDRIVVDPAVMNGQPTIRGMRLIVRRVVEAVALYPDREELYAEYPERQPEDVRQVLVFAARNLECTANSVHD